MNQDHVCVSWLYQEDTDNFTTWSATTIYLQQPIAYYEEVKQESLHKPEPMWDSRPS